MSATPAAVLLLPVVRSDTALLETAWHDLPAREDEVVDALGEGVADTVLALWALSRIGATGDESMAILPELLDEAGRPRLGGPTLRDMIQMAFSLGVAWEARRACSR